MMSGFNFFKLYSGASAINNNPLCKAGQVPVRSSVEYLFHP